MYDINKVVRDDYDGAIDWDHLDILIKQFLDSPEGRPFSDKGAGWVEMMLDYALQYCCDSVSSITPGDAREVVFSLFPEKVSTSAESAPDIISECRAFWQFLDREYSLKHAPAIVRLFDDGAVERLRRDLADSSNFGMAKSFFMQGQQSGFDMTTQEGLNAFMLAYNSRLLGSLRQPPPPLPQSRINILPPVFDSDDIEDEEPNEPKGPFHSGLSPKQRSEMRKKQRKAKKKKGK